MSRGHQLRVLHAAVSMNPSSGVVKQMEWEQQSANSLDIPWTTVLHTPKIIDSKIVYVWQNLPKFKLIRYFLLRRKFYQWLELTSKNYDLVLLRFSVHDPWQSKLTKKIGYKLVTIHHTKEETELSGVGGVFGQIKRILEVVWGRLTLKHVLGTVSVTPEIDLYEKTRAQFVDIKPSFFCPNGISYPSGSGLDLRAGNVPEIVFIASYFAPWHGLDLLISEARKNKENCRIHLVGKISSKDVCAINGDNRFVLHGHLNTQEIEILTEKMWVGLSSFAMFRNGMDQACSLKVREYLKMGLPVYAGHPDAGLPNDFPFYKQGDPNLKDILAYAYEMRSVSRQSVSVAAEQYISKTDILSRLYEQFQTDIFPKLANHVLESTPASNGSRDWQCDTGPTDIKLIAVTGASGFIGKALIQELLQKGFKVRALTRQDTKQKSLNLEWFFGDLQTKQDWTTFLKGVDVVIHTAAELNRIELMQEVNVEGPLRLLKTALSCGVKRWVQLSSVGAYGPVRSGWISEKRPINPLGVYEKTKTQFDEALVETLKGSATDYCIVRPSNVFGPGMRNQSLYQMQYMLKKGWFSFIGPTGASANYVYVDDVVSAVIKAAVEPAASNQIYIVSDWTTIENMALAMAQAVKASQPNFRLPLWIAKVAAYSLCWLPKWPLTPGRVSALSNRSRYSTQKIEKELGWHATTPLTLGIRQWSVQKNHFAKNCYS